MTTRAEIIEFVRAMPPTPFRHQGRAPGVGIDCIGRILVPLWHFELTDIDIKGYPRLSSEQQIYRFLENVIASGLIWRIPKKDRLPGDFALFRIGKDPQHFGWITDTGIAHATYLSDKKRNCLVEHSMDQTLIDSIIQIYRVRGIE